MEESVKGPAEWEVRKWRWLAGKRKREPRKTGAPIGVLLWVGGLRRAGQIGWSDLEILVKGCKQRGGGQGRQVST